VATAIASIRTNGNVRVIRIFFCMAVVLRFLFAPMVRPPRVKVSFLSCARGTSQEESLKISRSVGFRPTHCRLRLRMNRRRANVQNRTADYLCARITTDHFRDGRRRSPLPLAKGEDEGEGLFFCRSSSASQIVCSTQPSSPRTW
jgi:hypothetical protein